MRTIDIKIDLYKFEELPQESKDRVQQKHAEYLYEDWYEYTYDYMKEIGHIIGIDIHNIYFSGFWSQGDGACFIGNYSYNAGNLNKLKKNYSQETDIIEIADQLLQIQKKYNYRITSTIARNHSHYSHENSVNVESVKHNDEPISDNDDLKIEIQMKKFMKIIYNKLEEQYNAEISIDMIKEKDFEYTINGEIYN